MPTPPPPLNKSSNNEGSEGEGKVKVGQGEIVASSNEVKVGSGESVATPPTATSQALIGQAGGSDGAGESKKHRTISVADHRLNRKTVSKEPGLDVVYESVDIKPGSTLTGNRTTK